MSHYFPPRRKSYAQCPQYPLTSPPSLYHNIQFDEDDEGEEDFDGEVEDSEFVKEDVKPEDTETVRAQHWTLFNLIELLL